MSEINEQIWIGSYADSNNKQFLNERRIKYILCCGEEFIKPIDMDTWYRIPVVDNKADDKTLEQFMEGAAKLDEWTKEGHRVMVHCMAGVSRSVSVVITYLIMYKGWSLELALTHIGLRRPAANPHPLYMSILKDLKPTFYKAAILRNC